MCPFFCSNSYLDWFITWKRGIERTKNFINVCAVIYSCIYLINFIHINKPDIWHSKIVTVIKSETQSKSVGDVEILKSLWIMRPVNLHPKRTEKRRQDWQCEDRKVCHSDAFRRTVPSPLSTFQVIASS